MIGLYAGVTAASGVLALAYYRRSSLVDDLLARPGSFVAADREHLSDSDAQVQLAAIALIALTVAAAVATALWSRRVAQNARSHGVLSVRTGLATGGWFVPIGMYWMGFTQVRESLEGFGRPGRSVKLWQRGFIVMSVVGFISRGAQDIDNSTPEAFGNSVHNQWMYAILSTVAYGVCAWLAMQAANEVDAAVSPT